MPLTVLSITLPSSVNSPDTIMFALSASIDAIRAIKLISSVMANAIQEGKQGQDEAPAAEAEAPAAE